MYGSNDNQISGNMNFAPPPINYPVQAQSTQEKAIGDTLNEALGYIQEAEKAQAQMRDRLCGSAPAEVAMPEPDPTRSLEAMARYICSHTAMLAGEAKSLLARI